ncbi:MAG TPA: asparagine synthase (glutamine-hydrolyzing) [Solirubrobacteraceae bacterium]|jgi:asparagine synthase (glutamine-hydrolysing)|nr:asparagine synthase (glutamine-hydrolyzing) [Solirubrobacteraceae bacterium]
MCGICGVLAFNDSFSCDERLVVAMRDTMTHRGPDDAGVWSSRADRVALGHRRLSIVDVSHYGRQPMCNEDGSVWVTFNGEIYNHAALRSELEKRGHRYRSHCDTETIVHLYEEQGARCVERLDGMFAIAVWDARRRELLLARDRLGKKPLYWTRTPAGLAFASEIKALLRHPAISAELDVTAFYDYLTFVCTPAPATMFAGISKLSPAERMTVGVEGDIHSEIYWTPMSSRASAELAEKSENELGERLLELLRASIAKRMMSDVPFGVFLSGGVDSSTNVALMSELMSEPVRTFSVAFHGQERYNELKYARQIARRFATDHHEVLIDADDLVSFLPEMVHHQDEPIADWVCVPLYYVSKLAHDSGTTVVQVGEGSDELLHGYQGYIDAVARRRRWWEPFQHAPAPLRKLVAGSAVGLARRADRGVLQAQYVADAAAGRQPFWGGAICYTGELKRQILSANGARPDAYRIVQRLWDQAERDGPGADLLQKMTYLELKLRLAELLLMRVDKMTMATSVEARAPFLDRELVEFAIALPMEMKVREGVGKWLLKRTVDGLLPSEIVHRTKQGFGAPVAEWFRGELGRRAQREIRGSSLAERGLLDYARIDELWRAHRSGRANWGFQLWNLYNVSAWHDRWVAGDASA